MGMFDEKTKKKLSEILSEMKENVKIVSFFDKKKMDGCKDILTFLDDIALMSSKVEVKTFEINDDSLEAKRYFIDKAPAIILCDTNWKSSGIRYFGLPGGYEINSFVKGLLEVSGKRDIIPKDIVDRIKKIEKKVHIQVFVSLNSEYCPAAVMAAHVIALENENITSDMIESSGFKQYADAYSVNGVPKTVINNAIDFVGARSITEVLKILEKLQ